MASVGFTIAMYISLFIVLWSVINADKIITRLKQNRLKSRLQHWDDDLRRIDELVK